MFGQGEMVYNKNILVYKGRIIMYQKGIKRLLAVVLSACGLLVLSPLLLLLCLAIKLDSPGPIFFRQKRVGIHKSYFNILKFRTMRIDTPHDMPTHLLHDPEQYITRVGRFLRKTSLDEWAIWPSAARVRRSGIRTTCWPSGTSTGRTMSAPV